MKTGSWGLCLMQWGQKKGAWPARSSRGLVRAFAAAMGVAGAAFGSPHAALAQAPDAAAPGAGPFPAGRAPEPCGQAHRRRPVVQAAAAQTRRSRRRVPLRRARDRTRRLRGGDRRARTHALLQSESSPGEAPTRRALFSSALLSDGAQLFDAVLNAPDTPADVRTEVQTYLAAVDKALAINQLSVYGQFGLAYQTNANAGPNSANVLALGQNALLSPQFQKTPDWNAFGLVTVHDFYDFNDQRGDGWESDLITYYSQQFKVTRLDLGLAELRTGPRLGIGDYGGLTVHPYAIGNVLTLGGANYLNTAGAGVSLNWPVNETLTVTPGGRVPQPLVLRFRELSDGLGPKRRAVDRLCVRVGIDFGAVGPVVARPRLLHRFRRELRTLRFSRLLDRPSGCRILSRRPRSRIPVRCGRSRLRSGFPIPLMRSRTPSSPRSPRARTNNGGSREPWIRASTTTSASRCRSNICAPIRRFRTIACRISSSRRDPTFRF